MCIATFCRALAKAEFFYGAPQPRGSRCWIGVKNKHIYLTIWKVKTCLGPPLWKSQPWILSSQGPYFLCVWSESCIFYKQILDFKHILESSPNYIYFFVFSKFLLLRTYSYIFENIESNHRLWIKWNPHTLYNSPCGSFQGHFKQRKVFNVLLYFNKLPKMVIVCRFYKVYRHTENAQWQTSAISITATHEPPYPTNRKIPTNHWVGWIPIFACIYVCLCVCLTPPWAHCSR